MGNYPHNNPISKTIKINISNVTHLRVETVELFGSFPMTKKIDDFDYVQYSATVPIFSLV